MRRLFSLGAFLSVLVSWVGRAAGADEYPLDSLARETPETGRIGCPDVGLVTYRGSLLRYQKPVRIYKELAPRLRRFEELARDTAIEVYGRAPIRLVHAGAYNCRRVRGYPTLLSEHALGNALDVVGFDFGTGPRGKGRRAFQVRIGRDWDEGRPHARFLRLLAERVIADEQFRVILGPAYPGHKGHFHLDMAPYHVVSVF